jgi:hypothetical protein
MSLDFSIESQYIVIPIPHQSSYTKVTFHADITSSPVPFNNFVCSDQVDDDESVHEPLVCLVGS